ncbi:MAG: ChrB protein [Candidatus Rokuibacteriota bacterium]|nr:MAG: ChrB protein [Candidatus Rokubacteria bacterium]
MMHSTATTWQVLIVSLPREPSSLRVRAWRRLKALGALALKNGVYLLPATNEAVEQFQWLSQEVQRDGGDATLLRVERIENMPEDEIVRRFREARDADYRALTERYRRLLRTAERSARGSRAADETARLGRELARLGEIDYFEAPAGRETVRVKEQLEARLAPARPVGPLPTLGSEPGRTWVTRPRPHVDRLASAWFIRRFVDSEARFVFAAAPDARPPGAIAFDMAGVELGHHGDRCTFETLLAAGGRRDRRLQAMAEIVHEADLHDGKFSRDEARGLDLAIRSLLAALPDDQAVLAAGLTLFEGLYASIAS